MENISLVRVSLSSTGWKEEIQNLPCKENEKTISVGNKAIKKKSLLIPDTLLRENISSLYSYFIYCEEKDVEKAIDIIKDKIIERVVKDKENIDNVFRHI